MGRMMRKVSVSAPLAMRIPKWLMLVLTAWMSLQAVRLIAIPLMQAVLAGTDSPAWFYPAVLDVVVAAATPFLLVALWRSPRPATWLACWTYFVVSIVDHAGAIASTLLVGNPVTFQRMFSLPSDAAFQGILMGPGGHTLVDLACMALLMGHRHGFGIGRLQVTSQD